MGNYVSLIGIALILLLAFAWSDNRKMIKWRPLVVMLLANFMLGLLLLKVPGTSDAVLWLGTAVNKLSDYALEGASFVFGDTITFGKFFKPGAPLQQEFVFAVRIGVTIIFVCGLCSLGYYFGILQFLVRAMARVLQVFGLTGAEALSCSGSCWIGQVEAQLLIKGYMPKLTASELFTSMTNSMAVASGSALVMYMSMGVNSKFLITASVMSSVNAIILSKIKKPETEFEQIQQNVEIEVEQTSGIFDAAEKGVAQGTRIAVGVIVMVMFAIAIMALLNAIAGQFLGMFGVHMTLQELLGVPFAPVSYLIGVPWHEAALSGKLIATELLFNEVVSYHDMMEAVRSGVMSARTEIIMTCALCGFAHLGSIGIQIGGLGAMAPSRRSEIAKYAFPAMIIANMATWMTAAMCSLMV